MRLSARTDLTRESLKSTWYRAIPPKYLQTSLLTAHTRGIRSRFSAGSGARPQFEILYLCENPQIALEEVSAQFRNPATGRILAAPMSTLIMNVDVTLRHVVDLTAISQQGLLETNAQELTGDWRAYGYRQPDSSVSEPVGIAPTQELGQALYDIPNVEGFFAVSAKLPDHRNLVVFPSRLQTGSSLRFTNPLTNQTYSIS